VNAVEYINQLILHCAFNRDVWSSILRL